MVATPCLMLLCESSIMYDWFHAPKDASCALVGVQQISSGLDNGKLNGVFFYYMGKKIQ